MSTYSTQHYNGGALPSSGLTINNARRVFNFGERIAELNPVASPFFTYLSKVAKAPTDDPVFKFLEQRHQWQRRNFKLGTGVAAADYTANSTVLNGATIPIESYYDKYGRTSTSPIGPNWLVEGQVVAFHDTNGTLRHFRVNATPTAGATQTNTAMVALFTDTTTTVAFADNAEGQVVGTAYPEASGKPDGWQDQLYDREGYTQIFMTAIDLFSGTSQATRHRGISNEYQRVWREKLMEHKMDIEQAMLFGYGMSDDTGSGAPKRHTWGILPYTVDNGITQSFTYASSGYDDFMDFLESFFAPESGNSGDKLVLTSRNILSWMNKLGSGSFLNNIVSSDTYRLDVQNIKGSFGHQVTKVNTIFGNLHMVQEPLLRNGMQDYAICVDLKNVKYRPLVGNGISRDTFMKTNVQDNDRDGRQDMIITEAGLEISLPETHAVLQWS